MIKRDTDGSAHLVPTNRILKVAVTLWVLVVGPNMDALLASWDGERPNTSHDIYHNLSWLEQACDSLMLGIKLAVPVYLGVIKLESAASLTDLDIQVIRTSENFVGKGSKLVL
ncbi:hypothetical protein HG531_013403 [Fusarium graminearum]|nr:hypothetical protein HG531_013403 [Fusarium graminearum]